MRIFMLAPNPGARGPVPKHTAHLVAALRELGCTIVLHPWGQYRANESVFVKLAQRGRDALSARRALKACHFDVVVIKTAHDWRTLLRDLAVVFAIRPRCRPIVVQLQGSRTSMLIEPGSRVFKLGTAALLALVDGVMVLSTQEHDELAMFRPATRIFTVKNPYVSAFHSNPAHGDSSLVPQPRLLFVGRMIKEKGIFDLVEAFADVRTKYECELVLVGDGNDEADLRQRISRLGIEKHVTMLGYLSGPALTATYREATMFVLPSWSEGFPTVLAEAMDAGLPIVTTRIRGAIDHLIAGENALFVEPRDARGLGSAISTLLQDRDLQERMGSANRNRIHIFDPQTVASEYRDVLLTLIKRTSVSEGIT
jgi:glycosyltransferase involved in cell wall biosynthesis